MLKLSALLLGVLFVTSACDTLRQGHLGSAPRGCTSCFEGLPLSLTKVPGSVPEERRLNTDLSFVDAKGLVWKADAGDVTDGASIPSIFLPITGPRFERHFLPAAVIHDHYTDKLHLVRSWQSTARVFHEAMLANGTPVKKAKLMFYAVYVFGPHWGALNPGTYCGPNCVNLTATQSAPLQELASKEKADAGTTRFVFEAEAAQPSDVAELVEIRSRIAAGENAGRPLSLEDLESEAQRRHPDNPFLATRRR